MFGFLSSVATNSPSLLPDPKCCMEMWFKSKGTSNRQGGQMNALRSGDRVFAYKSTPGFKQWHSLHRHINFVSCVLTSGCFFMTQITHLKIYVLSIFTFLVQVIISETNVLPWNTCTQPYPNALELIADANHSKFTNPHVMVSCAYPGKPSMFHSSWSHLLWVLIAISLGALMCEE